MWEEGPRNKQTFEPPASQPRKAGAPAEYHQRKLHELGPPRRTNSGVKVWGRFPYFHILAKIHWDSLKILPFVKNVGGLGFASNLMQYNVTLGSLWAKGKCRSACRGGWGAGDEE